MNFWHLLYLFLFLGVSFPSYSAQAPAGFNETTFVENLNNPTLLNFSPDGRLFVSEQGGTLRLVKDGVLETNPILTLTVDSQGEHGLLGVTFDPDFTNKPYIYVYYTATQPAIHQRLSRFLMTGDTLGAENVLFDFDPVGTSIYHVGGKVEFGPDGKLYVGEGDNAGYPLVANAQQLTSTFGKFFRLNSDGTIPTDNPFYQTATGNYRAIWAYGLRNPFTFDFLPSGRVFIDDVGESSWEEINDGMPGKNYGWPNVEGDGPSNTAYQNPLYTYAHGSGANQGCAITGGTFYTPKTASFPAQYANQYFFVDYCGNWIEMLNPATGTMTPFATQIASNPVDLRVGPDGALYYVSKWFAAVYRLGYSAQIEAPHEK
jgi:glucose/arabinose dehydrogenase